MVAIAIAVAWGVVPKISMANPVGGVAVVGQANMVSSGKQLLVTTQNSAGTNHSSINWQSFSIPAGETTYFQQPNASSTSINRVVTNTPSLLFGTLGSNGNLVLVNQSGIAVGAGAVVDTAGFTASSLQMSDNDALVGRQRFGDGMGTASGVSVQGNVLARHGDVVLLGSRVDVAKDALIQSPSGSTILAAGRQVEITGRGLEGIVMQVQAPTDAAVNLGTLQGGAVGIFAGTLKHSGAIQANSLSLEGGRVVLKALDQLEIDGQVHAQGISGQGGSVHATANKVTLTGNAVVDVSGATGGGEALIGGGWQGGDSRIGNAQQTLVASEAQIRADATETGVGGTVVLWADGLTRFAGSISAHGGFHGGDGGLAEISGKQYLDFQGTVDLTAPAGSLGSMLLDPASIEIGPSAAIDGYGGDVTAAGILVTDYPSATSRIKASTVSTLLGSGNLSLAASGNIMVIDPILKTAGGATTLTLTSTSGGINLNAPIGGSSSSPLNLSVNGASVQGSHSINTFGGNVSMQATTGSVTFSGAIDAGSGKIKLRASGDLTLGGSSLSSGATGDAIVLESTGGLMNAAGYGGSVSAPNGRWLVYLPNIGSDYPHQFGPFGLVGATNFRQYSAPPGTTPLGSGNGHLYAVAATLGSSLGGEVSKQYDGGTDISLSGASFGPLTGYLATDSGGVLSGGVGTLGSPNVGSAIPVTVNGLTVTGVTDSVLHFPVYGYQVTASGNIGVVTPAPLTTSVSMAGSRVYDGTNIVNADIFSLSGLVAGETLGLTGSGTVADKNVGDYKPVSLGTLTLIDGSGQAKNYTFSGGIQVASITPLAIDVGGLSANNKIYDGTTTADLTGGVLIGSISGDSVGLGSMKGAFSDKNVGVAKSVAVTGLTLTGTDAGNYMLGSTTASYKADITPKDLSVSAVTAANKVYDGTTAATLLGGTLSGAIAGDSVTLLAPTGAFSDRNVGVAKSVAVTGLTLTGTDAGNYKLGSTTASTSADITPKDLSVSAVTAANKVYDGTTAATLLGGTLSGAVAGDSVTLSAPIGTFSDKNVGVAKSIAVTGLAITGADVGNYALKTATATTSADITPKALTLSGVTAANKVYDGKTDAEVVTTGLVLTGLVNGDSVAASNIKGSFLDKNVGIAKSVQLSGVVLTGTDALNYTYFGSSAGSADISVRPLSTWTGALSNLWGDSGNWDALPDGANVQAVTIGAGSGTVVIDGGSVSLQALSSGRTLAMSGGSLQVSNAFTSAGFTQTGGALSGAGTFKVNGSFDQSGGSVAMGTIEVTQTGGTLTFNNLSAKEVSLSAGRIVQTGGVQTAALTTASTTGTLLNGPSNRITAWKASNRGTGAVELLNTGTLDLQGISNSGGRVRVSNTGGVTTTGALSALGGDIFITANSPLTIGGAGLSASGDVVLRATNLTSAGDLTLDGPIESTTGAVVLSAANNLTQNSSVRAPLGISAEVGGILKMGPLATSGYPPVRYSVAGTAVAPPPSPGALSVASDMVVAMMQVVESPGMRQTEAIANLPVRNKDKDRTKEGIVAEGGVCRP
jgi:filamentous hemagglutinin family protein